MRPQLLPRPRWARIALLLLVLFALLRSVLWASVQPAWFAPDEDYHLLYINYMSVKHTVPSLDKPFYTAEFYKGVVLTGLNRYLSGTRSDYNGRPKAVLQQLGGPISERNPAPPVPRPVLHPPGYYLGGLVVDRLLWSKVSVTRLTGIRYYSALLGAITVFLAWVLAAQVLAREWERLGAAALVSVQPIMAFSASTITNDVAVALTLTATMAWLAWMLRAPPVSRQGVGLGLLLTAALFVKATMLSVVLVIAFALLLMWRTYPSAGRQLLGVVKWTVAIPAVLAGWWYLRLLVVTGSILGEHGSLVNPHGAQGRGLLHAPSVAWLWISQVYRSYWFDYNSYEVRTTDIWFWLPLIAIGIVVIGFLLLIRRLRGTLTVPGSPQLRQVVVLVTPALLLFLPPFGLDVLRGLEGLPFTTMQGRFLAPAYPALAVIGVLSIRELTRRVPRVFPVALAASVAAGFILYWHTWVVWVLERFYGAVHGHWLRALLHASYDKPNFVTQSSLAVLMVLALLLFIAAYAVTLWGARPRRTQPQQRTDNRPVEPERATDNGVAAQPSEIR